MALARGQIRTFVGLGIDCPPSDLGLVSMATGHAMFSLVIVPSRPSDLVWAVLVPFRPVHRPQHGQLLIGQLHVSWTVVCEHQILSMLNRESEVPSHGRFLGDGRLWRRIRRGYGDLGFDFLRNTLPCRFLGRGLFGDGLGGRVALEDTHGRISLHPRWLGDGRTGCAVCPSTNRSLHPYNIKSNALCQHVSVIFSN